MDISNQEIKLILNREIERNSNIYIAPVIRELLFIDLDKEIDWQKLWLNFLRYNPHYRNEVYLRARLKEYD